MMYPRCRGRLSNIDSFKRVFQTGGEMWYFVCNVSATPGVRASVSGQLGDED